MTVATFYYVKIKNILKSIDKPYNVWYNIIKERERKPIPNIKAISQKENYKER